MISFVQNAVILFLRKIKKEKTENNERRDPYKKSWLLLGLYISPHRAHTTGLGLEELRSLTQTLSLTLSLTHACTHALKQGPKSFLTVSVLLIPGEAGAGTE